MIHKYGLINLCSLLILITAVSCSQPPSSHRIKGRNIDSLMTRPYQDRLLAFSIELGVRSKDFDERFDRIIEQASAKAEWKGIILAEINKPVYLTVETHNVKYLDSLFFIIQSPPEDLKSVFELQSKALDCFKDNYHILKTCESSFGLGNILDKKLRNDMNMNASMMRVAGIFNVDSLKR
jgi:hypothetical protein